MAGPERGQAMARLVFVSFYLNHGSEQPTLYLHVYLCLFTSRDGLVEAYMCIHTAYMCTAPLPIGIAWPCSAALAIGSRPALARTHGKGSRRGCNGDGGALASAGQLDYHR